MLSESGKIDNLKRSKGKWKFWNIDSQWPSSWRWVVAKWIMQTVIAVIKYVETTAINVREVGGCCYLWFVFLWPGKFIFYESKVWEVWTLISVATMTKDTVKHTFICSWEGWVGVRSTEQWVRWLRQFISWCRFSYSCCWPWAAIRDTCQYSMLSTSLLSGELLTICELTQ